MEEDASIEDYQERKMLTETRSKLALEKLRHIRQCPQFTSRVRKLVVNAYASGDGVFKRNTLIEALAFLPNLRMFIWHGKSPKLNADIIKLLAANCPALEELSAPNSQPELYRRRYNKHLPLSELHNLQSLSLIWQDTNSQLAWWHLCWPIDPVQIHVQNDFEIDDEVTEAVRLVMASNTETLQKLTFSGPRIWHSPMPIFCNLAHLDLVDAGGWDKNNVVGWGDLGLILHHSIRLESLSIIIRRCDTNTLYPVFGSRPTALLLLVFFKVLNNSETLHLEHASSTSEFLRHKPWLQHIDLLIDVAWDGMLPVLLAIANLKSLEVLGLDVNGNTMDHLQLLEHSIPPRVSILRLDTHFHGSPTLQDWLPLIKERLQLSFFFSANARCFGVSLEPEHFLTDPGSLVLVAVNDSLFDVIEPRDNGTYPGEWPKHKRSFLDVESIENKDWKWLLCHHRLI
ncbi:hypothetical protein CERSUDRAFT_74498 [Gelatoporia subvermispora B]|uniref:F-box domain-containing protein n=1 Tax=Ceriporiopsis subvermispora (strain B) TaxID=914234 RepID=M2PJZ4_CERS8|nr:hypothetical protein CERSUDRAFT_74498 [Gelatoporia subvermispora B]